MLRLSFNFSFVDVMNYGLSGPELDHILLSERSTGCGCVLYKGILIENDHNKDYVTPLSMKNIEFLTHFSVSKCTLFFLNT